MLLGRPKIPLAEHCRQGAVRRREDEPRRLDDSKLPRSPVFLCIGSGHWWLDAIAAMVIGLDITRDGWATSVLPSPTSGPRPTTVDSEHRCRSWTELRSYVERQPWSSGQRYGARGGPCAHGEVYVVSHVDNGDIPTLAEELTKQVLDLDWRLHDIAIVIGPGLAEPGDHQPPRSRSRQGRPSGSRNPR